MDSPRGLVKNWRVWSLARWTALLAICVIAVSGCQSKTGKAKNQDNTTGTLQPGVLRVITATDQPPYSYVDSQGRQVGFTYELIKRLAQRNHLKLETAALPFSETIPAIIGRRYDTTIRAINQTPEREKTVSFSAPHTSSYIGLLVRKNSDADTLPKLSGKTVAVTRGSIQESYLREHAPNVRLRVYSSIQTEKAALLAGQVDAWLTSGPMARTIESESKNTLILAETLDLKQSNAFPVAKGNEALIKTLNAGLDELFRDGSYTKLYQEYFDRPVPHVFRAAHPSLR